MSSTFYQDAPHSSVGDAGFALALLAQCPIHVEQPNRVEAGDNQAALAGLLCCGRASSLEASALRALTASLFFQIGDFGIK